MQIRVSICEATDSSSQHLVLADWLRGAVQHSHGSQSSPELRAAATPIAQADTPVGQWNHFEITVKGKTVTVALNGKVVIPGATIPNLPDAGRIALQHHGSKDKDGNWTGPPSLVQFKNIYIKELNAGSTTHNSAAVKGLLITGGHDHDASFYSIFSGVTELGALPVVPSATAFKNDLRGKCDVVIMYDFSRDLDDSSKKNLRDFVESGGGVVVLHHAAPGLPELGVVDRPGRRRQLSPQSRGQ